MTNQQHDLIRIFADKFAQSMQSALSDLSVSQRKETFKMLLEFTPDIGDLVVDHEVGTIRISSDFLTALREEVILAHQSKQKAVSVPVSGIQSEESAKKLGNRMRGHRGKLGWTQSFTAEVLAKEAPKNLPVLAGSDISKMEAGGKPKHVKPYAYLLWLEEQIALVESGAFVAPTVSNEAVEAGKKITQLRTQLRLSQFIAVTRLNRKVSFNLTVAELSALERGRTCKRITSDKVIAALTDMLP